MLGIRASSVEDPTQPLIPHSMLESLGYGRSDSGINVSEKQAMRLATVYGCIKVIGEDLSSVGLSIYQSLPNNSTRKAPDHRLWGMLHDEPSPYMSAMIFREALIACNLIYGNAYVYINRDKATRPVNLLLLPPDKTQPSMVDGALYFVTTATKEGTPRLLLAKDVIHVPALSFDGITGISPIRNCMQAVGLGIAAEKFGCQFFGNGARASGVFSHPGTLDTEAYENLKKSIQQATTGDNALRPIILEEGLKWDQVTIPPEEAQFLETRKFQRSEIAAIFRVPLHLLQDLERSTNSNIEHQSIEYVRHTLRPLAVRIEQEINRKLLPAPFFCEHDLDELMRGDFATQTAGFEAMRNAGVYSSNDIRRRLRENPIPAEEGGDVYLAPLNYVNLAGMVNGPESVPPDSGVPDPPGNVRRERITAAFRPLFRDFVGRAVNRANDKAFPERALQPIVRSMAETLHSTLLPGAFDAEAWEVPLSALRADLAQGAGSWTKQNSAETATALCATAYEGLAAFLLP